MTPPAVRHHLAVLTSDARLELAAGTKENPRGRPALRYRLSERLEGDNLAMVADAALNAVRTAGQPRAQEQLVKSLAVALVEKLGAVDGPAPSSRRLTALVERLSALHYAAHWEAGASGPRLILGRCPYASVIRNHPELCQMDARAISELAGTRPKQLARIDLESQTPTHCVFLLE